MSVKNFVRNDQFFRTSGWNRPASADGPLASAIPTEREIDRTALTLAQLPTLVRELSAAHIASDSARRFITAWGRLSRLQPSLLPRPNSGVTTTDWISEAQTLAQSRGAELAAAVFESETATAEWAAGAAELERLSAEDSIGGACDSMRAALAERLIERLDEIQLACAFARRYGRHEGLGGTDEGLEKAAKRYESLASRYASWLASHAELFIPAASLVRATLTAMRPDLPSHDRYLAKTTVPFLAVLGAAEKMELALSLTEHAPLAVESVPSKTNRSPAGRNFANASDLRPLVSPRLAPPPPPASS